MRTSIKTAAAALALALAAVSPAAANSQLAASAGLSPAEAAGLTTAQIAQHFFNRGASTSDLQTIPGEGAMDGSGAAASNLLLGFGATARSMPDASAADIAIWHANRGVSTPDRQVISQTSAMNADRSQLAASAGLGLDGAVGRSRTEIADALYNRGMSSTDRQMSRN